jgi:hypothetical protein
MISPPSEPKRADHPSPPSRHGVIIGASLLALVGVASAPPRPATAADHTDAPLAMEEHAADLSDLYAWHTERGTLVVVLTFASLLTPGDATVYDANAVYVIHVDNTADQGEKADWTDNDNDNVSDLRIQVRFGQNNLGDWGVQLLDVPGADGPIEGPVDTVLTSGSATAIAGYFDDPFFFDFEGFVATRDNLLDDADPIDVAFSGIIGDTVDFFAGTNAMAIVVELDLATVLDENPDNFLQLWATSGTL